MSSSPEAQPQAEAKAEADPEPNSKPDLNPEPSSKSDPSLADSGDAREELKQTDADKVRRSNKQECAIPTSRDTFSPGSGIRVVPHSDSHFKMYPSFVTYSFRQ
jgi:hypothetical protein